MQQIDPKADVQIINQADQNFITQSIIKFKTHLQALFPAKITYEHIENFPLEVKERSIARFAWALSHMPLDKLESQSPYRKNLISNYKIKPDQLDILLDLIKVEKINFFNSTSKNDARVIRDHISETLFRRVIGELVDNSIAGQINLQLKDKEAIGESFLISEGVIDRVVDFSSAFIKEYRSMKQDLNELFYTLTSQLGLGEEKTNIFITELKRVNFYFSRELKDIYRWLGLMKAKDINIFSTRSFNVTGTFRWGQRAEREFTFSITLPKRKDFVSISVGLSLGSQTLNILKKEHAIIIKNLVNENSTLDISTRLEDKSNDHIISRILFSSRIFLAGLNYESIYRTVDTLHESISGAIKLLDNRKRQQKETPD
ncbi:MAG: hypothetical protein ACFFBD_20760 [Candidatus Hodarchaeota archaeon]